MRSTTKTAGARRRGTAARAATAVGAAVLAAGTMMSTAPLASSANYQSTVGNESGVPLWGEFHTQCGSAIGNWSTDAAHPWATGTSIDVSLPSCGTFDKFYAWGRVCWQGKWRNLERGPHDNVRMKFLLDEFKNLIFSDKGVYGPLTTTDGC